MKHRRKFRVYRQYIVRDNYFITHTFFQHFLPKGLFCHYLMNMHEHVTNSTHLQYGWPFSLNTIHAINQTPIWKVKRYSDILKRVGFLDEKHIFFSVKHLETLKAHNFASSGFKISTLLQFRNSNKNSHILDFEVDGHKCCSLPTD